MVKSYRWGVVGSCGSVTPSPIGLWIFYFFGFGIGIGSRRLGMGLGLGLDNFPGHHIAELGELNLTRAVCIKPINFMIIIS